MASLRPQSAAALTAHRREAIKLAKAQEKAVFDKCTRSNQAVPGYTFDELIGKGSFGRVYKGRQNSTRKVVAIKVLDIDDADFQAFGDQKDEQIRDFNREIQILRQAQASGAQNLNQMIEALPVHSQLWLICEYCPGGSVKTLMRATQDRLPEKYLVVVARELSKALQGLHLAGIMHRDVKAANVLIHENGGLQLCDFGVAATLEGNKDKRRTFIGTLHWMPPELWTDKPEYSDEVDVWGYGCTLYECATGVPPNADLRERQQLKMRMRRLKQPISLPEKDGFSDGLRSLVRYALDPDAAARPSMYDILQHDFLAGTEQSHPTKSLTELVQHYYAWLFSGGQRISLFMPGGAVAASVVNDDPDFDLSEEWNFSMTQDFEKRVSAILEIPDLSDLSFGDDFEGEVTPRPPKTSEQREPAEMTATQKVNFERRVQRGEGLANLFDHAKPAYEYKTKTDFVPVQPERRISDLPFRAMAEERPSSIASNVIDLGDFDSDDYAIVAPKSTDHTIQTVYADPAIREPTSFQLADAATIRAKRADSKGPKDAAGIASRSSSGVRETRLGANTAAYDFALAQEDWTVKDGRPALDEAAEITPTATRAPGRNTMEWSFAGAMGALSADDNFGSRASTPPSPQIDLDEAFGPTHDSRAKKHATIEWSFSNAMAEIANQDSDTPEANRATPKRPTALLRTVTQPVTQHEMQGIYDDSIPSRPDTAMSLALSEISQTSTDVDPFALERHHDMDDFDHTVVYEHGPYVQSARALAGMSMNGPGPEESSMGDEFDSMTADLSIASPFVDGPTSTQHDNGYAGQHHHVDHENLRTYRDGRGLHMSRGSGSSRGSNSTGNFNPDTPSTAADMSNNNAGMNGLAPPNSLLHHHHHHHHHHTHTISGTSSVNSTRSSTFGTNIIPNPKPPSAASLAHNASIDTIGLELGRLLNEFSTALTVAGEVLQEELRGRGRRRRGSQANSEFGPSLRNSGSDWEDESDAAQSQTLPAAAGSAAMSTPVQQPPQPTTLSTTTTTAIPNKMSDPEDNSSPL